MTEQEANACIHCGTPESDFHDLVENGHGGFHCPDEDTCARQQEYNDVRDAWDSLPRCKHGMAGGGSNSYGWCADCTQEEEVKKAKDELAKLTPEQWIVIKRILRTAHDLDETTGQAEHEALHRTLSRQLFQWDDVGRPGGY